MLASRGLLAASLHFLCASVIAVDVPHAGHACGQVPEAHRWISAGTPDLGANPPVLSAHRGGATSAPENTMWAYRHALAYDMDFIEVDVRETSDGVFISMHDSTVNRTTDGSGEVAKLTWAQIEGLNAADFKPWKGGPYDPARVPRLEEILTLARDSGKGIEFDIKSVRNYAAFFDLAAAYGLVQRSYFALRGDKASAAQAYNPEIRAIYNLRGGETVGQVHQETRRTAAFGSRRERFTPELIAAIHDGCALALPHSYDRKAPHEAEEFRRVRAMGADGAQVNQPDVIAEAANRNIPAELVHDRAANRVCLRNAHNALGLPRRALHVFSGERRPVQLITDKEGCVSLPNVPGETRILHSASGAVQAAALNIS